MIRSLITWHQLSGRKEESKIRRLSFNGLFISTMACGVECEFGIKKRSAGSTKITFPRLKSLTMIFKKKFELVAELAITVSPIGLKIIVTFEIYYCVWCSKLSSKLGSTLGARAFRLFQHTSGPQNVFLLYIEWASAPKSSHAIMQLCVF